MLRVLLHTNQLVNSLLSTQGPQARLVDAWRRRDFILCLAPKQLDEVSDVLARPKIAKKYRTPSGERQAFLELLRTNALLFPEAPAPGVCPDPDDDAILGCASGGAVDYLVTEDGDLLEVARYDGVRMVTEREFLTVLLSLDRRPLES
ncbi:MAG TPA: putative toxin-antitoxin system toxin component, PIN family [Vicinamibacteria bacterium]|nr:putative toxin-antitoxin system toxin component, PIN family [Vicinamibacteria bacterium]